MATESGRPNEFADDAHFWPEDPSEEQLKLYYDGPTRNDRILTRNYQPYPLYLNVNGRQYKMPVTLPETEE